MEVARALNVRGRHGVDPEQTGSRRRNAGHRDAGGTMTFSLIGRCARTGQFGAAVSTSNIAVGSRVPFCAPGVGAVLTQHRTDPRLGPRGIALLRSGCSAEETVEALVASTPHHAWRQLAAIDAAGRTAHFHGAKVKPAFGAGQAPDCIAIGNILANDRVPQAMADAFGADPSALLAERHDCLNLRFPGAQEYRWTLVGPDGPRRYDIAGPFESDDGDVLTGWALDGRGIVLKPLFEVAEHLASGALVPVATATPPLPVQLCCLMPHRRLKDPKTRLLTDFMATRIRADLAARLEGLEGLAGLAGLAGSGSAARQLPR